MKLGISYFAWLTSLISLHEKQKTKPKQNTKNQINKYSSKQRNSPQLPANF